MTSLPAPVVRLRDELRQQLGGEVEVEPLERNDRFLFTIISPAFKDLSHLQRQDRVWQIIDQVCNREESLMVSLVLAYAPGEIEAFVDGL